MEDVFYRFPCVLIVRRFTARNEVYPSLGTRKWYLIFLGIGRFYPQVFGDQATKRLAAILVYPTKESNLNSFLLVHQHGGLDVT